MTLFNPSATTEINNLTNTIIPKGDASSLNSSTSSMGAAVSYTGSWEDVSSYSTVMVAVKTDASGVLKVDFSPDQSNIDSTLSYNIANEINEIHRLAVSRKYFRIRYGNGDSPQSYFRLQSLKGHQALLSSPLNGIIQTDSDAIIVRSIETELDIVAGRYVGYSINNKIGRNPDNRSGNNN